MILNEQQLFRDENIKPTGKNIAESIGLAKNAYESFTQELKNHDIQMDWRYYNDGKAWFGKGLYKWSTIRGTQKETTAFWLSIWDGFFKVAIYIPEKNRSEVLKFSLNNEVMKMVKGSKQMGKLKFFPLIFDLYSDELFDDIFALIDFRKTLK